MKKKELSRRDFFIKGVKVTAITLAASHFKLMPMLIAKKEKPELFLHPLLSNNNHDRFASLWRLPSGDFLKRYEENATTITGKKAAYKQRNYIPKDLYIREKNALISMQNSEAAKYLSTKIIFDDEKMQIQSSNHGLDLLVMSNNNPALLEEYWLKDEIIAIHKSFQKAGIFKRNPFLNHFIYDHENQRLRVVGFSRATARNSKYLQSEIARVVLALQRYNADYRKHLVLEAYSDFDRSEVQDCLFLAESSPVLMNQISDKVQNAQHNKQLKNQLIHAREKA